MNLKQIVGAAFAVAAFCSCVTDPVETPVGDLARIEITASLSDSDARTTLDQEIEGVRNVLWEEGDCVALFDDFNAKRELELQSGEGTNTGTFLGAGFVDLQSKNYYVISPASSVQSVDNTGAVVTFPTIVDNTEGNDTPLVGLTSSTGNVSFVNVCGYLDLKVAGYATISSVTVTSKSKVLSGSAKVSISSAGVPTITLTGENSVTVEPAAAIALSTTPRSILVPMPAATYPAGDLTITLNGAEESFEFVSSKSHSLVRSHIKPITGFYVESSTEFVNLTADGAYANCFVTPKAGWYMFDAKTKGGFAAVPHPASGHPFVVLGGDGATACVAWESSQGMITDVAYDDVNGKIIFNYNGVKGNALICLIDNNGDSLWNWHIWATDTPQEQTIGEHVYLDRNVGAWVAPSSLDDGLNYMHRAWDNAKGSYPTVGLLYQWGRPTPFPNGGWMHLRNSGTYQREHFSTVFADQGVETTESDKDSAKYGDTPAYYFPSEELIGSTIYTDRSAMATKGTWTNKWWYVNNTTNVPLSVAMQNPMTTYGTAADNVPVAAGGSAETLAVRKFWCNDLFAGSFDFASASAPWNYAAQGKYIFDVCPYGYHVAEANNTIEDFATLSLTWRYYYYSNGTTADEFIPKDKTTYTAAAYATAADGSFVWIPTSGARVFYGAFADQNVINWWGSSSNNKVATVQFAADDSQSASVVVKDGYCDKGAGTYTKDGTTYNIADQNSVDETSISMALAVRCVKDPEKGSSMIPVEDLEQNYDGNAW